MTNTKAFSKICSYQRSNFTEHFGSLPFESSKVKLYTKKLGKNMLDKEILAEFKPTEVTTGEIFNFLESAGKNEWYIFYSRGKDNVLWAVNAYWSGDDWDVSAYSVEDSNEWDADDCVASRDSFEIKTLNSDPLILRRLESLENIISEIKKLL